MTTATLDIPTQLISNTPTEFPTTQSAVVENTPIPPKPIRKKPAPKHDFRDGFGRVFAHKHARGGGWVSDKAKVAESVYVGPRCGVGGEAVVEGNVRLEGRAKISGRACVRDFVVLRKNAQIYDSAVVVGRSVITDDAAVYGEARIGGRSEISGGAHILGSAFVCESNIGGQTAVFGETLIIKSTLSGHGRPLSNSTAATRLRISARNNPCLCVFNFGHVQDSQIFGAGFIYNRAKIINSRVSSPSGEWFEIFDNATILHDSSITSNFRIGGNTVAMHVFFHSPSMTMSPMTEPITLNRSQVFIRVSVTNNAECDRHFIETPANTAAQNYRQQVAAAAPVPHSVPVPNNAGPVQIPGFGARRIIRAD